MSIGGHHSSKSFTDEWLTPPEIIAALGKFDLDPCSPVVRPIDTAALHYSLKDNGLNQDWKGRVWLNPPYGRVLTRWMQRMAKHNDGIALVFARTETEWFSEFVFKSASAILFLKGRLNFHTPDGAMYHSNAGAPSVLCAYDAPGSHENSSRLMFSGIEGTYINLPVQKWRSEK